MWGPVLLLLPFGTPVDLKVLSINRSGRVGSFLMNLVQAPKNLPLYLNQQGGLFFMNLCIHVHFRSKY